MNASIYSKTKQVPKYESKGAVCFDLVSSKSYEIRPMQIEYISTGIVVEVPKEYGLFIFARSSLHKKGLMLANSVGIIDNDYNGEEDEIKIILLNFSKKLSYIKNKERIAQAVFLPVAKCNWTQFKPQKKSRGGIGSTGEI